MFQDTSPLQIIAESVEWVCVHKPVCWLSVPSRDNNEQRPIVGLRLQEQIGQVLFPVHRLDYEVSGLLIFAKNKKMQALLNSEFERQTAQKFYLAMTTLPMGAQDFSKTSSEFVTDSVQIDNFDEVLWTCNLEKGKRRAFEATYGKKAVTRAQLLGRYENGVLSPLPNIKIPPFQNVFSDKIDLVRNRPSLVWKLQPMTGRSHQLRYEMFRHGCPILGDTLYGFPQSDIASDLQGIALCHYQITLKTLGTLSLV